MTNINTLKLFIIFIPIISFLLIIINYMISPKSLNYDISKTGPYECGFDSFRQSRTTYSIQFILIAILFLPFDLELTSILPYTLTIYHADLYGLYILLFFLLALIIGFIIEINLKAIYITKINPHSNKVNKIWWNFLKDKSNLRNNNKYTQLY